MPVMADQLRNGVEVRRLVAAAALANAGTFGGEDYVGFHTLMALAPAFHMSQALPAAEQPLPVFKVLYRNTRRIQEHGGCNGEVLRPVAIPEGPATGEPLREAVRRKDVDAFNHLLMTAQDRTEVHCVVLPYRAWDLLGIMGREQAHTLLRQSVRYCVKAEFWPSSVTDDSPRQLLPRFTGVAVGGRPR